MIRRIIHWSLENQFLVTLGLLLALGAGIWSLKTTRVDAIPDLSDVQVIIHTDYSGQAPQVIEDQVTYPLTSKMLAVPRAKVVRGYSFFGTSFVYVLFEEGTDLYWARSRVLEYLSALTNELPPGVTPQLGPDATGVGWAFMYVINSPSHSLAELRTLQDYYLGDHLATVEGVSEVASIGGFVKQYQVEVDPLRLRSFDISLAQVRKAIQDSNLEVGGHVLEAAERELMVRGRGYIQNRKDLEQIVLSTGPNGTPLLLSQVAEISIGPEIRRGVADWNGLGETVGGIVIVRDGADTRRTITRVKEQLENLKDGLPAGVGISVAYDRSDLIDRSIATLFHTLIQESIVVAIVCILFLFHFRSSLVAIISIPLSILLALFVMRVQGLGSNIMSLGGIAISIGVLVDAAVIMIENAHKHTEENRRLETPKSHFRVILESAQEVGPTLFFTLLILTVSFLPVFSLEAQEGRLFKPLALTKTYSIGLSAILAITVVPVLMFWFVRGRLVSEEAHPVSRALRSVYRPILHLSLRWPWVVFILSLILTASTLVPLKRIGSEFMPPLWEGDLLYMPTTFPGLSIAKAREITQQTDRIIKTFPEVESVFGKAGRADTATDPAPLSMLESTIILKDPAEWRPGVTPESLVAEMDRAIQFPGLTNSWTMPIKTRIEMLATGIKTPIGIKVGGADLLVLDRLASQIEAVVGQIPGTLSAYAERVMGGQYLDYEINREAIARFGLSVRQVDEVIQAAVGGLRVSSTIEGVERYGIQLRYPRELRDSPEDLGRILVRTPSGSHIPLRQLATIKVTPGPPMIKSEGARPNAWIYVDLEPGTAIGTWVQRAQEAVAQRVERPNGYTLTWSGQYEAMERARQRLLLIVPLTLLLILAILYVHTQSLAKTLIVLSAIPFALVGSFWTLDVLGFNLSVAVWVGLIALAGLAAETGVVMLLYLDIAFDRWQKENRLRGSEDLVAAIDQGAVQRIRPKTMAVVTTFAALVPILWSTGTGSDVMQRIAAPMIGGLFTSFVGELIVFPAIYFLWRSQKLPQSAPPPRRVEGASVPG